MGCWNGTCMISNLPIIYGDEIKLVLIRKSYSFDRLKVSGGYVYPSDAFTPSFLPINGKYNDYGMIENVDEDWNYNLIENVYKDILSDEIIVDGNKKTEWNLIDVLKGIERNDIRFIDIDEEEIKIKR